MNIYNIKLYTLLTGTLFFIDRLTKYIVMYAVSHYKFNDALTFDLIFNRGISFGLFHSENMITFTAVNILVGSVIALLAAHTYSRMVNNQWVIGEAFIFTGAISNVIDRYLYGGVIDFIALSYGNWHFAVFNLADIFIFVGVVCMLILEYRELWKK